jgi:anti-sigma regulatory factor (Ser/Thr protein kinase)
VSPRESKPDRVSHRLRGGTVIIDATKAARAFGESQWLGDDELARLCIVVEELVANLYDHGGLSDQDDVGLDFAVDPDGIRVSIADPGAPFDPWSAPRKSAAIERGGGVGIDIIRAWAEFISYGQTPGGNRLEFLLPIRWDS